MTLRVCVCVGGCGWGEGCAAARPPESMLARRVGAPGRRRTPSGAGGPGRPARRHPWGAAATRPRRAASSRPPQRPAAAGRRSRLHTESAAGAFGCVCGGCCDRPRSARIECCVGRPSARSGWLQGGALRVKSCGGPRAAALLCDGRPAAARRRPVAARCDTRLSFIVPINKLNTLRPRFAGHRVPGNPPFSSPGRRAASAQTACCSAARHAAGCGALRIERSHDRPAAIPHDGRLAAARRRVLRRRACCGALRLLRRSTALYACCSALRLLQRRSTPVAAPYACCSGAPRLLQRSTHRALRRAACCGGAPRLLQRRPTAIAAPNGSAIAASGLLQRNTRAAAARAAVAAPCAAQSQGIGQRINESNQGIGQRIGRIGQRIGQIGQRIGQIGQ